MWMRDVVLATGLLIGCTSGLVASDGVPRLNKLCPGVIYRVDFRNSQNRLPAIEEENTTDPTIEDRRAKANPARERQLPEEVKMLVVPAIGVGAFFVWLHFYCQTDPSYYWCNWSGGQ